jgi:hypothetical protein
VILSITSRYWEIIVVGIEIDTWITKKMALEERQGGEMGQGAKEV